MTTLELILTIIQLLSGLAVTVIVLMQSGKSAGLSGRHCWRCGNVPFQGQSQDARRQARQGDQVVRSRLCCPDAGADRADAQGRIITAKQRKRASPEIFGGCSFSGQAQSAISPDIPHGCRR